MKKYKIHLRSLAVAMIALTVAFTACDKNDNNPASEEGKGSVKVAMAGAAFDLAVTRASQQPQVQYIDFADGIELEATLTPQHGAQTRATEQYNLDSGVKYRLLFYKDGAYVTQRDYSAGNESGDVFVMDAGTYSYVAYSFNTTDALPAFTPTGGPSALTFSTSNGQDLMVSATGTIEVKSGESNTISKLVLIHQFSQVRVKVDATDLAQNITAVSGVTVDNNYPGANWTTTAVSFTGTAATKPIVFNSLTAGQTVESSDPGTIVYSNTNAGSTINFGSLTIGNSSKSNISVGGFSIQPKTKYLLTLKATKCYKAAANKLNTSAIAMSGYVPYNSGPQTITIPGASAPGGFQLNIYTLDNSFTMEINGQKLYLGTYTENGNTWNTNELNFQGWTKGANNDDVVYVENNGVKTYYPPNIEFKNGDRWGIDSNVWPTGTNYIFYLTGSVGKPIVRITVKASGEISLEGSKWNNDSLLPLALYSGGFTFNDGTTNRTITVGGSFNTAAATSWNKTGDNKVKISMVSPWNNCVFNGDIYGLVPCTTAN